MKPPSTPGLPFTGGAGSADTPKAPSPRAPRATGAPPRGAPPSRRAVAQSGYGRQIFIFVVLLAAAVVMVAAVTGERGYLDVRRQRAELGALRAEVDSLRRENVALLGEVRGLRSDPYVIEALARERLGYARPGEIVFRFPPERPSVPEAPPPVASSPRPN